MRSDGIDLAPAIRLKNRYHCIPVIVSIIDVRFNPPGRFIVAMMMRGKRAVAGIDAITCTAGSIVLNALLFPAIFNAKGRVHARLRRYASRRRNIEELNAAGMKLASDRKAGVWDSSKKATI